MPSRCLLGPGSTPSRRPAGEPAARRAAAAAARVAAEVEEALRVGGTNAEEVEAIFHLTARPTFEERFVVPPLAREVAIEQTLDPFTQKREGGFGFRRAPARGA